MMQLVSQRDRYFADYMDLWKKSKLLNERVNIAQKEKQDYQNVCKKLTKQVAEHKRKLDIANQTLSSL